MGGYQLLVDATDAPAVARLRRLKCRPTKPLALLVASAEAAREIAEFDATELGAFQSAAGPIVLGRSRLPQGVAGVVHPALAWVGVMLPTTPLHALLADACTGPLVCTSGNLDGEPLVHTVDDAETQLAGVCDMWLHHDRLIERPIDDGVVRVVAGRVITLRLGRGLAPLGLDMPSMAPALAVGGHLKCAAAWSNGQQTVLGPHVGDMDTTAARQRYVGQVESLMQGYDVAAEAVVCDAHPDYFTTRWAAERWATQRSASEPQPRCTAVQHHHAHVAAGMLEHGWLDRRVLGVSWDGTGYGDDGSIWGGEFLLCDDTGFRRVAHLRPFRLPGGERAAREPWRTAVSVLVQTLGVDGAAVEDVARVARNQLRMLTRMCGNERLSPLTTSAGRLFDAAACLILGISEVSYEGEAAMRLESLALDTPFQVTADGGYPLPLVRGQTCQLDWRPLFHALLADRAGGVSAETMATRFHRGLACGIVEVCRGWTELPVVLAGGVFQNKLLTEMIAEMFAETSQPLGLPGVIPPGDGGLAAGQLAVQSMRRSQQENE
ncbi:MAG: Sua5/YciO/YrdC/YwlC family protein [Pirellulales bacterium]